MQILQVIEHLKMNMTTDLSLPLREISRAELKNFINALKKNTSLRSINLHNSSMNMTELKQITEALSAHPTIENVTLAALPDKNKGIGHITALAPIFRNPRLKKLNISNNDFNRDAILKLAKLLEKNKTLLFLDIHDNKLLESSADEALVSIMQNNKMLILIASCKSTSTLHTLNARNIAIRESHDEVNYLYDMEKQSAELKYTDDEIDKLVEEHYQALEKQTLASMQLKPGQRHPGYIHFQRLRIIQQANQMSNQPFVATAEIFNKLANEKVEEIKKEGNYIPMLLNEASLNNQYGANGGLFFRIKAAITSLVTAIRRFFKNLFNKPAQNNREDVPKQETTVSSNDENSFNTACFPSPIASKLTPKAIVAKSYELTAKDQQEIDYRQVLAIAVEQLDIAFNNRQYDPNPDEKAIVTELASLASQGVDLEVLTSKLEHDLQKICFDPKKSLVYETFSLILQKRNEDELIKLEASSSAVLQ